MDTYGLQPSLFKLIALCLGELAKTQIMVNVGKFT